MISQLLNVMMSLPPPLVLLLVFALPAAEASVFVGLLIPGETAVVIGGVLAHAGLLPLWAVIGAAAAGAVLGDQIGFHIGRRYGDALLARLPRRMNRRARPARILAMVRRRGALTVVVGRWTASLRALVPGIAGMSGLSSRTFSLSNVVGGAVWATAVGTIGYLAGAGYRQLEQRLHLGGGVVVAAVVVVALAATLFRRSRRRDPQPADEHTDRQTPRDAGLHDGQEVNR